MPQALSDLIDELTKLPGIGPRTAERLAMYILRQGEQSASDLANALLSLHEGVRECQVCHNLTAEETCGVCDDQSRDESVLAIVEDALDVIALERTSSFTGRYHVLGGIISPVDGVGPEQINLETLKKRVEGSPVTELILATNPSVEGEATAHYIRRMLPDVSITRLARGLPMGSDLEYADETTLTRALEGRQSL
ncbi:recombination protein RecR [Candidatus Saccharibacteria bacterium SW_7_54_9]|nr:MAG: recombination protein RecR [Candidatus Saccharibacteria bacterium SW_7_54_9]